MNIRFHPSCIRSEGQLIRIPVYVDFIFYVVYLPDHWLIRNGISNWACCLEMINISLGIDKDVYVFNDCFDVNVAPKCIIAFHSIGRIMNRHFRYTPDEFNNRPELIKPDVVGDLKEKFDFLFENIEFEINRYKEALENHIRNEKIKQEEQEEKKRAENIRFGVAKKYAPEIIRKMKYVKVFGLRKAIKSGGIYFLCRDNELVYIGQSVHVHSRVRDHIRDKEKDFNAVYFIEMESAHLCAVEKILIAKYAPPLNKMHNKLKVA